jgi:hypothetical protein
MGVAVNTEGIAPDRGAMVGVALAALVEGRLAARGVVVGSTGGSAGWRANGLVESPSDAAGFVDAVRASLLVPVSEGEPALGLVAKRATALSRLPPEGGARLDVVRCTGEAPARLTRPPGPHRRRRRSSRRGGRRPTVWAASRSPSRAGRRS